MTNEKMPLVSVIIAAYNAEKYIAETIESVLAQSYQNWELIIADDVSTDTTRAIADAYAKKDPRIKVFTLATNSGQAIARNQAIEKASGDYLAILDADDIALPKRLEVQIAYLEQHPDVAVLGSAVDLIDEKGAIIGKKVKPEHFEDLRFKLLLQTQFIHSTVCMRKKIFIESGGYDNEFCHTEDFDLWSRLNARDVRLENLPDTLVRYRVHAQSVSISTSTQPAQAERAFRIIERNVRRYLPATTRKEIVLLSKLVNESSLPLKESYSALILYRRLTCAYLAFRDLHGVERATVLQTYHDRRRHVIRTGIKRLFTIQ